MPPQITVRNAADMASLYAAQAGGLPRSSAPTMVPPPCSSASPASGPSSGGVGPPPGGMPTVVVPPGFAQDKLLSPASSAYLDHFHNKVKAMLAFEKSGPPERAVVLKKSGKELFRELLRIYSEAVVDDYFQAGQWLDDRIRTDYVLLEVHRKEAGAISPPALEDVVVPEPKAAGWWNPWSAFSFGSNGVVAPRAAAVTSGATAEVMFVGSFLTKWKLDPPQAKAALENLSQQRRHYVLQRFGGGTAGADVNAELLKYIAACEMSGAWDKPMIQLPRPSPCAASQPSAAPAAKVATPRPASDASSDLAPELATPIFSTLEGHAAGVKRPADPEPDPSKKARTETAEANASPAAANNSSMLRPSLALRLATEFSKT